MVHVIASVRIKEGKRSDYLGVFKTIIPVVRSEKGCVNYFPAIDLPADLPAQKLDEHMVTIIETWESLDALYDHLKTPHYLAYREQVKDIVENVSLKVLQEA